jgi:hypothetical protein
MVSAGAGAGGWLVLVLMNASLQPDALTFNKPVLYVIYIICILGTFAAKRIGSELATLG